MRSDSVLRRRRPLTAPIDNAHSASTASNDLLLVDNFSALYEMLGRLATRKVSVCPSVCLSVKRMICDKTEERYVRIFKPYGRSFSLVY